MIATVTFQIHAMHVIVFGFMRSWTESGKKNSDDILPRAQSDMIHVPELS